MTVTRETLQALKDTLSENRAEGPLTLREFGEMLGKAAGRRPYHKSYVWKLLRGEDEISAQVEHAARVLMLGAAALEERSWIDPLPHLEGGPIDKLKGAQASGVGWQKLYAADADVRRFVDVLMDVIVRG